MILKENIPPRAMGFFFLGWFLVTILGYGFAGLMFHFPSGFPPNNYARVNVPGFAFGIFMGALSGLVIGGLQALVLRLHFKKVRWWLAANMGAFAIIHAIGDGLPDATGLLTVQISGGVILGLALWLAVKRLGANALYWIVAIAAMWSAGLTAGLAITEQSGASWQLGHVIAGVCSGVAVALATAGLLWQLMGSVSRERKIQSV